MVSAMHKKPVLFPWHNWTNRLNYLTSKEKPRWIAKVVIWTLLMSGWKMNHKKDLLIHVIWFVWLLARWIGNIKKNERKISKIIVTNWKCLTHRLSYTHRTHAQAMKCQVPLTYAWLMCSWSCLSNIDLCRVIRNWVLEHKNCSH